MTVQGPDQGHDLKLFNVIFLAPANTIYTQFPHLHRAREITQCQCVYTEYYSIQFKLFICIRNVQKEFYVDTDTNWN